jgi:hypothetical protein
MKAFLAVSLQRDTVLTSAKVALVVGSVLALINYGDRIFVRHDMRLLDWTKLLVSYCVPFCVATYGAARYALRQSRSEMEEDSGDARP